ncbi:MAG: flagellar biosynthesis anti-sigma factor FlgM [Gammaproteobacteria bacterium]|nr:flagellar biosynthesis anti-sigma factor FlgM [Gammaproteobacteria bacterium]
MVTGVNGPGSGPIRGIKSQTTSATGPNNGGAAAATGKAGSSDVVTITDLASRIRDLVQSVESLPHVDQQRVAEIRQQIADGSYEVDPRATAEKLLEFESMLREHLA